MTRANHKKKVQAKLDELGFTFEESNTRMNYGMIGKLFWGNEGATVIIFPACFYVRNGDMFPLNKENLKIITRIQKHYKEL